MVKRTAAFIALGAMASMAFGGQDCAALLNLTLEHATITNADQMTAGAMTKMPTLPAFCRVQLVSKPSNDSNIKIEIWLPTVGWNGKFQGVGNGGFAGSVSYDSLAEGLRNGYATASTDTGHEAGAVDASWALGHPEKVVDFGYRAIHEMTISAKAVIREFYGSEAKRAYFNGCSNGGRQALMEAQRYPADYEGIVAGAPANYWTHLMANAALNSQALLQTGESYISPKKLPAIQAATMAACDANDGVKDGVIGDPTKCRFDTAALRCQELESDTCLTTSQEKALKTLYSGSALFPGYPEGAEADPGGWDLWITGPAPERSLMNEFATQFFRNMQFSDKNWDVRTFRADQDTKATDDKLAGTLNSTNADLRKFQARGGKLILYHGWNDPAIAAPNTLNYYRSVVAKMGQQSVKRFVRVFMAPGVLHCNGGDGPSDFGQFSLGGDAEHSVDAALKRWVETGVAPERVVAVKHVTPSGAIVESRPLCAFPLVAKYRGSGDTNDAGSFSCGK